LPDEKGRFDTQSSYAHDACHSRLLVVWSVAWPFMQSPMAARIIENPPFLHRIHDYSLHPLVDFRKTTFAHL